MIINSIKKDFYNKILDAKNPKELLEVASQDPDFSIKDVSARGLILGRINYFKLDFEQRRRFLINLMTVHDMLLDFKDLYEFKTLLLKKQELEIEKCVKDIIYIGEKDNYKPGKIIQYKLIMYENLIKANPKFNQLDLITCSVFTQTLEEQKKLRKIYENLKNISKEHPITMGNLLSKFYIPFPQEL